MLYDDCVDHPVRYTITADQPDATWQLSVDTADPTGARGGGNDRSNSLGDPAAGTVGVQMCGASLEPGTFTLSGVLIHGVGNVDPVPPSTFTMRNPMTRTRIKASTTEPRRGQHVTITIKSRDEMPEGWRRKDDARVVLQRDVRSTWVKVQGGRARTDDKGKAVLRFAYPGRKTRLRAVTRGSADWDGWRSSVLVLR